MSAKMYCDQEETNHASKTITYRSYIPVVVLLYNYDLLLRPLSSKLQIRMHIIYCTWRDKWCTPYVMIMSNYGLSLIDWRLITSLTRPALDRKEIHKSRVSSSNWRSGALRSRSRPTPVRLMQMLAFNTYIHIPTDTKLRSFIDEGFILLWREDLDARTLTLEISLSAHIDSRIETKRTNL